MLKLVAHKKKNYKGRDGGTKHFALSPALSAFFSWAKSCVMNLSISISYV